VVRCCADDLVSGGDAGSGGKAESRSLSSAVDVRKGCSAGKRDVKDVLPFSKESSALKLGERIGGFHCAWLRLSSIVLILVRHLASTSLK
jgi:hypothetical protein